MNITDTQTNRQTTPVLEVLTDLKNTECKNIVFCVPGLAAGLYVAGVFVPGGIRNHSQANRHTSKKP